MHEDDEYDRRQSKAEAELSAKLTPEFLSTLTMAAEVIGWSVDVVAVRKFLEAVHGIAEVDAPGWEPRNYSEG